MSSPTPLPAGAYVVLVGPDGTGKTTLARALAAAWPGPVGYFHFRPPVRTPLQPAPPDADVPPPGEKLKVRRRGDLARGWVRLLRTAAQCLAAHWLRIGPAIGDGALVIGDRWVYGYLSQPESLRFYGPAWLARTVVRALPQPTLLVVLTAPVPVLLARKQELTAAQLEHELDASGRLPAQRRITLSSQRSPAELAAQVLNALSAGRADAR